MAAKYSSTCVHCGPCERYARNGVCVTCAARRAAEAREKRKQARELGATATDVVTGRECRVCGEPWRYAVSRKCVTCAEQSGTEPKPKREPKPKPEPKGRRGNRPGSKRSGHIAKGLGNAPLSRSAYNLIAKVPYESRTWELWERQATHDDWRNFKLVCVGRAPKKANYWVGWCKSKNSFGEKRDTAALAEYRPLLLEFIAAAARGDDIELLFGGEYCTNEQLMNGAQQA